MRHILKRLPLAAYWVAAVALAQPAQVPADQSAVANEYIATRAKPITDAVAKRMLQETAEDIGMTILNQVGGLDPTGIAGTGLTKLQESMMKSRDEEGRRLDAEIDRLAEEIEAYTAKQTEASAARAGTRPPKAGVAPKKAPSRQTQR